MTVWDAEAQNNLPAWVCIWLKMLFASFVVGLLFSWKHSSARWLVGSFVASMFAIDGIFPVLGVSVTVGLIALVHILLWLPGLFVFLELSPYAIAPYTIVFGHCRFTIITIAASNKLQIV